MVFYYIVRINYALLSSLGIIANENNTTVEIDIK